VPRTKSTKTACTETTIQELHFDTDGDSLYADARRFRWLVEQVGYDADFNAIANRSKKFGFEIGVYHDDASKDKYGKGKTLRGAIDKAMNA
jgi:hypothetical protein